MRETKERTLKLDDEAWALLMKLRNKYGSFNRGIKMVLKEANVSVRKAAD
jgi:hypothetical protein